jgi:DNA-binding transcriptional regulator YbjK
VLDHSDLEARLLRAACTLCLEGGLSAVTFRGLARVAEVSVGLLGHQFGSHDQLLERLIAAEGRASADRNTAWQRRMAGNDRISSPQAARLVLEWLDNEVRNHRGPSMLLAELRIARLASPACRDAVKSLSAHTQGFWHDMLAGRLADGEALAPLVAGLCTDDLAFGLALGDLPAYRIVRSLAVEHLVAGFPGTDPPELATCHAELATQSITADSWAGDPADRATQVAEAIADLIEEGGAAAVSHRRVAALAGMPHTSVAHYFRTSEELMRAGIGVIYRRIRNDRSEPRGDKPRQIFNRIGRSTHGMALAAARNPAYRPYAIDMRWRRGENLQPALAQLLGETDRPGTRALTAQTLALAGIGASLLAADDGQSDEAIARHALDAAKALDTRTDRTIVPENPPR